MNMHDSRRIEEVLLDSGYQSTESTDLADVVVVNTCSIREKAEHKLMSHLGRLRPWKDAHPGATLVVAGCVAQQEGQRLIDRADMVDLVIGPDNIPELTTLIDAHKHGAPPTVRTVFDVDNPNFLTARVRDGQPEISAFVTTMKGCDERCTYCIVPHTRGVERYRPADHIVDEVKKLVDGGVREITLVGQTVNSWFDPSEHNTVGHPADPTQLARDPQTLQRQRRRDGSLFADLLRRIAREVPSLLRLRYTSPHPRHMTDDLLQAHVDLDVLSDHLHLPVQSGSNAVLRRMSRRYTREHYLDRVAELTRRAPNTTLSTDIIVGFPGETDGDFEDTLGLVRDARFVSLFGFKYSPRPFTPALKLGDTIPEEVKEQRLQRLFEEVDAQQIRHLNGMVGTQVRVLLEKPNPKVAGSWTGRTHNNEIVHVNLEDRPRSGQPRLEHPHGALVSAHVDVAHNRSLGGSLLQVIQSGIPAARPSSHPTHNGSPQRSHVHLPLAPMSAQDSTPPSSIL